MNDMLYTHGYQVIEGFYSQVQTDYFLYQVVNSMNNGELLLGGGEIGDGDAGVHPMTWNVNSHPVWQNTLYSSLKDVETIVDEKLIPIYTYQRTYMQGAEMSHHSDWPWCQISLTINIGQSSPYPIYVTDLQSKKSVEVVQKPGDAILYLGHNVSHYRNKFVGDWYSQLFLHYVLDNDSMRHHTRFDGDEFQYNLKNNYEEIFYTKEAKKNKSKKYKMRKDKKDLVKPIDSFMFTSTKKGPPDVKMKNIDTNVSMIGGQYSAKTMEHFMDSVHITKDTIPSNVCTELIDLYEEYAKKDKVDAGLTHKGIDPDTKDTGELDLMLIPEGVKYIGALEKVSDHCILNYTRKYGMLQHYNSDELHLNGRYYPMWEIHKYEKGIGHYESWHTEGSHMYEYGNRIFTSMFYLNDVEEGGRTVFPFTGNGIKCEEGKHLAFPCYWPYVHYAQTPLSSDKYIITTWLQSVWPEEYQENFVRTEGHDKDKDIRKTKFIWDKGG